MHVSHEFIWDWSTFGIGVLIEKWDFGVLEVFVDLSFLTWSIEFRVAENVDQEKTDTPYVQDIECPYCGTLHRNIDIVHLLVVAPDSFRCRICMEEIDIEVETGIFYEEACEQAHTETLIDAIHDTHPF